MNKYQIRQYKKNEWDVVYHDAENGNVLGSPETFTNQIKALAYMQDLIKNHPTPSAHFLSDWLLIDKD